MPLCESHVPLCSLWFFLLVGFFVCLFFYSNVVQPSKSSVFSLLLLKQFPSSTCDFDFISPVIFSTIKTSAATVGTSACVIYLLTPQCSRNADIVRCWVTEQIRLSGKLNATLGFFLTLVFMSDDTVASTIQD